MPSKIRARALRRLWSDLQWPLIGVLWALAISLGITGFSGWAALHGEQLSFLDDVYLTLQLLSLNLTASNPLPWQLQTARFLIPGLAALSAAKAFATFFQQQARLFMLQFAYNHVIICGLSRKGFHLVNSFYENGETVVVIEENEDNEWLEQCRELGATVLVGDATEPALLRRAGALRARSLIAVCDNDGVNAEVAVRARDVVQKRSGQPLLCLVHLVSSRLCELLRERETDLEQAPFRLELFNVFERGARLLLQSNPDFDPTPPLPDRPPHLLVIGVGRMGENVVLQAGRAWWNRGRQARDENWARMQVTVIDQAANAKVEALQVRFPRLASACDLTYLEMDVRSSEFLHGAFLFDAQGRCTLTAIYICMDDDSLNLQAGLALLRHLPEPPPIVMRMAEEGGLASLLGATGRHARLSARLSAFGLLERTCTPDLLLSSPYEMLARALHEEYVRRQTRAGVRPEADPALRPWDKLPDALRQANFRRVERIRAALKTIGAGIGPLTDWDAPSRQVTPQELEPMARRRYELKSEEQRRLAGRPLAPVPWEALCEEDKEKERERVRAVPHLLALAGYQIVNNS